MSWSNLIVRIQQKVVGLLDYESRKVMQHFEIMQNKKCVFSRSHYFCFRCHLRICSKDDRDVVDSTKFHASKLKIQEFPSDMSDGKVSFLSVGFFLNLTCFQTIIRCDVDTFTIWFIGKENITRVDRGWNGEVNEEISEIKQENRYDVMNRFFEKLAYKGVIKVNSLELESVSFLQIQKFSIDRQSCDFLIFENLVFHHIRLFHNFPYFQLTFPVADSIKIKCNCLKIINIQDNHHMEWIRNTDPFAQKFKKLELRCWGDTRELREVKKVLDASESLDLDYETEFTDEDLETIEAMNLTMSSTRLTVEGAKRRLEAFLRHGKKEDVLQIYFTIRDEFQYSELFPQSLKIKKLKREHEQEGDYYGKVFRGFENIHGVDDPREIDCISFGLKLKLICKKYLDKHTFRQTQLFYRGKPIRLQMSGNLDNWPKTTDFPKANIYSNLNTNLQNSLPKKLVQLSESASFGASKSLST
ncbi:hypothetical protein CRE_03733 [Caenorhabditis remanei]|uniref:Uncharacterized protein n=1 Tax=Caenorhabditis remanei TaxID=31234 RepID=E3LXY3_CAERE|nr:hypothetical protein CRE_03733 [Caenorhabditis remanei]